MNPTHVPTDLTPAQQMEAEERALLQEERCDDQQHGAAARQARAAAEAPPMQPQQTIHPRVTVNTEHIAEQDHEPTPADEMEAEERELVIEDSVDDVLTYARQALSDEEIRRQAITEETDILPRPENGDAD